MIVGLAVTAAMSLFTTCTVENQAASEMTVATMMAENIRETMAGLSFADPFTGISTWGPESGDTLATFNDIDDFDGQTFNPPIDATRKPLPQLSQYTQIVSVMPVDPNGPGGNTDETKPAITKGTYTGAVRVRVRVLYRSKPTAVAQEVYATSWVRADD
jgi:hypothetical protein